MSYGLKTFAALIIAAIVIAALFSYGWIYRNQQSVSGTGQNTQYASKTVAPGPEPSFSCGLMTQAPTPVDILNTTGLLVYNVSGIQDYVMAPGSNATISYGLDLGRPGVVVGKNGTLIVTPQNGQASNSTIDQNLTFYHQESVAVNYTVSVVNQSALPQPSGATNMSNSSNASSASSSPVESSQQSNSSPETYKSCYAIPGVGTTCTYSNSQPQQKYTSVNITSYAHGGLSAVQFVLNTANGSQYVTVKLNANQTAQQGTYWVSIGGNPCNGGTVRLFTVGSGPYFGSVSNQIYS